MLEVWPPVPSTPDGGQAAVQYVLQTARHEFYVVQDTQQRIDRTAALVDVRHMLLALTPALEGATTDRLYLYDDLLSEARRIVEAVGVTLHHLQEDPKLSTLQGLAAEVDAKLSTAPTVVDSLEVLRAFGGAPVGRTFSTRLAGRSAVGWASLQAACTALAFVLLPL